MRRNILCIILLFVAGVGVCAAQETNLESDVTRVINHAQTALNSVSQADSTAAPEVLPLWKQKLYYGYNFDIYYHQDSRSNRKENGWSVSLTPEIGWRLNERMYMGVRLGGSYQDSYLTYVYEALDGAKLHTGMAVGEVLDLQEQHQLHDFRAHGVSGAAGVGHDKVVLELAEVLLGDGYVVKGTETRCDPVHGMVYVFHLPVKVFTALYYGCGGFR